MAVIGIANSPAFLLPVTGGNGLYAVTIISAVAIAAGCYVKLRKKNEA
jgi:LPXTG-motif cell wall-anchored protein